jgi:virulence factor
MGDDGADQSGSRVAVALRIGVVGAGNVAQVAHLPALARHQDVTLAGLVTRSEASARRNLERWPFERSYPSVEELLSDARLDAVFVLTPRLLHVEQVRLGLEAGVDVFVEKPLASSAAEALALARLAEGRGRLLMVNFNRRFAEPYVTARDGFGAEGPRLVVAEKNRAGSEYRASFENAIHMVDLLRWCCGEALEVSAQAHAGDPYMEEDLAALLRFESGATGVLVAARNAGLWDERMELYGGGLTARVVAPDHVDLARDGQTTRIEMRPRAFGWAEARVTLGFQAAVDHFVARMTDRAPVASDGLSAARTQELLERILAAAGLPLEDAPDAKWVSRATG